MKEFIRRAEARDLSDVVILLDIASQGLLNTLWQQQAGEGNSPIALGRERIRTRADLPSFIDNWQVMVCGADIAGGCAGYKVPDPYEPDDIAELPEYYAPLLELESRAAGTFHMIAIAVFPDYRGRGIATKLLSTMERTAVLNGSTVMSIIAKGSNSLACGFYEANGYTVIAQCQAVPTPCFSTDDKWLLYQRPLKVQ